MTLHVPSNPRLRTTLILLAFLVLAAGCKSPDGPHFPIADQDLTVTKPDGLTRVVFLNTNYESENWGSGPIRIQLGGKQMPSVWPERFVQAFVEPGEYDLHLEQAFGFYWKERDVIQIEGDQMLISVYQGGMPLIAFPEYRILDVLPSDFETAFRPARHPDSW